mmetsp:Transcript_28031/g.59713  ORF Transcript_28031/g.59713 Transcript_28031/m.59713 type:complete len:128 (-) Transcript_28031:174-557(-)
MKPSKVRAVATPSLESKKIPINRMMEPALLSCHCCLAQREELLRWEARPAATAAASAAAAAEQEDKEEEEEEEEQQQVLPSSTPPLSPALWWPKPRPCPRQVSWRNSPYVSRALHVDCARSAGGQQL